MMPAKRCSPNTWKLLERNQRLHLPSQKKTASCYRAKPAHHALALPNLALISRVTLRA
jgi:hypothetical protein